MGLSLGKRMNWLWIFPAIGAVMLAIACMIHVSRVRFEQSASRASGEVIALERSTSTDSDGNRSTTYCAVVRFNAADGKSVEFQNRTCSSPAGYDVGERVQVLYPADAPRSARLDGFADRWLGTLVVGCIGTVFLAIGLGLTLPTLKRRRNAAELRASGRPVMALVSDVAIDRSLSINGRSPWRIHAQWQDGGAGKLYLFESDNLWFDPAPYVHKEIRVLINPTDPTRYWVDTSGLPDLA